MINPKVKTAVLQMSKQGLIQSCSRLNRCLANGNNFITLSISDIDWDIDYYFQKAGLKPQYYTAKQVYPVYKLTL